MPGLHSSFTSSFSSSISQTKEREGSAPRQKEAELERDLLSPKGYDEEEYDVYSSRWWVLTVVSTLTALQGGMWNIYGPTAPALQPAFGWNDGQIALFPNWGTIGWFIAVAPCAYVMDSKGLRPAVLAPSFLIFAGSLLRICTTDVPAATWLCNTAQLLNGLAGPVGCAAPPLLSATWFAPQQRTTATSISTVCNYLGVALSFILGPLLVPKGNVHTVKHDYMVYMWGSAIASGIVFLAVVVSFPNAPPTPPSPSAAVNRIEFTAGLRQLIRMRAFWFCGLSYGLVTVRDHAMQCIMLRDVA